MGRSAALIAGVDGFNGSRVPIRWIMGSLLASLGTLFDLTLVVFGFGMIIFIHELGHFLAARWAGIRVLAFAIGFGPAALSFRKGMGWRRGSSEREYLDLLDARARGATPHEDPDRRDAISPTEYRLNWLPLGGYVKMLGQEDLNPQAVSSAPDSYQSTKAWKRMIVISAGVVANVVTAALLFMLVYGVGIRTEPARIGGVALDSPASTAMPLNGEALGVREAGLRAGDEILSINDDKPRSFNDLVLAVAMARGGDPVRIDVAREGFAEPLRFAIVPEAGALTGMLEIGVEPARSATVARIENPREREEFEASLAQVGLAGIASGMTLREIDGVGNVRSAEDLRRAIRESEGRPIELTFADGEREARVLVTPRADLEIGFLDGPGSKSRRVETHLLGLRPLMRVDVAEERAKRQGLMDGDVFLRIGGVEYPSLSEGMAEIRASAGRTIPMRVRRGDGREIDLNVSVSGGRSPRVGFIAGDTSSESSLLARSLERYWSVEASQPEVRPSAAGLGLLAGSRVVSIEGREVADFSAMREALRAATLSARDAGGGAGVTVEVELPGSGGAGEQPRRESVRWMLTGEEVQRLHALSWSAPFSMGVFDLERELLRARNPLGAVALGLHETKRVMLTTYVTFARLFEGTVKVEHLKGPVGIAHLGTRIAERGLIWLLFFLALVSVNLAVINFLPLPIVDGGQFMMLVYEQARGRPVPVAVQNAMTLAGLALICVMFVVVTYNDVVGLFGG